MTHFVSACRWCTTANLAVEKENSLIAPLKGGAIHCLGLGMCVCGKHFACWISVG